MVDHKCVATFLAQICLPLEANRVQSRRVDVRRDKHNILRVRVVEPGHRAEKWVVIECVGRGVLKLDHASVR